MASKVKVNYKVCLLLAVLTAFVAAYAALPLVNHSLVEFQPWHQHIYHSSDDMALHHHWPLVPQPQHPADSAVSLFDFQSAGPMAGLSIMLLMLGMWAFATPALMTRLVPSGYTAMVPASLSPPHRPPRTA